MGSPFNPYAEWLGLPRDKTSFDHFELIGVSRDESDPQVIAKAANQALASVRRVRPGTEFQRWERLLDEINAARTCLLDPVTRDRYRQSLARSNSTTQGTPAFNSSFSPGPTWADPVGPSPHGGPLAAHPGTPAAPHPHSPTWATVSPASLPPRAAYVPHQAAPVAGVAGYPQAIPTARPIQPSGIPAAPTTQSPLPQPTAVFVPQAATDIPAPRRDTGTERSRRGSQLVGTLLTAVLMVGLVAGLVSMLRYIYPPPTVPPPVPRVADPNGLASSTDPTNPPVGDSPAPDGKTPKDPLSRPSTITPKPTDAQRLQLSQILKDARQLIEERQFEPARAKLKEARSLATWPEAKRVVERAGVLYFYANDFHEVLRKSIAGLKPFDDLPKGSKDPIALVVEASPDSATVKFEGKSVECHLRDVNGWDPVLLLAIADSWRPDDPAIYSAAKGAFLATIPDADEKVTARAREFLRVAAEKDERFSDLQQAIDDTYEFAVESEP